MIWPFDHSNVFHKNLTRNKSKLCSGSGLRTETKIKMCKLSKKTFRPMQPLDPSLYMAKMEGFFFICPPSCPYHLKSIFKDITVWSIWALRRWQALPISLRWSCFWFTLPPPCKNVKFIDIFLGLIDHIFCYPTYLFDQASSLHVSGTELHDGKWQW